MYGSRETEKNKSERDYQSEKKVTRRNKRRASCGA